MIVAAAIIALLGAFMNWIVRGGGWKSAIYKNKPPFDIPEDYINAVVYGGAAWFLSGSIVVAILLCIAMFAGSAPGWGEFIGNMLGTNTRHGKATGVLRMTLRGGFWGLCFAVARLIANLLTHTALDWKFACAAILAGLTMGVVYNAAIRLFKIKKWPYGYVFNHWTVSEMVHGAIIWLPLVFLYYPAF